jgi:hypothetical protein
MIETSGTYPEDLPIADDIKKVRSGLAARGGSVPKKRFIKEKGCAEVRE